MNYEEKYKKAFERAVNIYGASETKDVLQTLETIFPELKKSEDERIRKAILSALRDGVDTEKYLEKHGTNYAEVENWFEKQGSIGKTNEKLRQYREYLIKETERWQKKEEDETLSKIGRQDCIGHAYAYVSARAEFEEIFDYESWPEKQGEQKPTDKVESKFKVGDWVVIQGTAYQITKVENLNVTLYLNGRECLFDIDVLKNAHLWTIQDAKDGDVLTTKDTVFIFKHMDVAGLSLCRSYCEVIGNSKLGLGFDFSIQTVHPATKEQSNFLFKKIKEEGYEWDAEKKELKKIEQKPTWSEEDKNIEKISEYTTVEKDMDEYNKGFECGKQRVLKYPEDFNLCEKSASDWSEEDVNRFRNLIYLVENSEEGNGTKRGFIKFINQLKSLKGRVQPKQEWSEEDENAVKVLMNIIKKSEIIDSIIYTDSLKEKLFDWLKSIKERMKGE